MNDDNTHGETPAPETPTAGSTPTTPQAPVPGPAAPVQSGHGSSGSHGSAQQAPTWQPPHAAPAHEPSDQDRSGLPRAAEHAANQPAGYAAPAYSHSAAHITGTAFGAAAQPRTASAAQTLPLDPALLSAPAGAEHTDAQPPRKVSGTPTRVAGLLLAAALVGGVAGFGGSALGGVVFDQPVSQSAAGPQTVTVNNPGSVNETTAIASKVLPSVVTIEVAGNQGSGSGSGVVLDKEGHVLTNTHVATLGGAVADPTIRVTTSDGHIYSATVVGTDPVYDLAVIKLKDAKGLTPIAFAESSDLNVGDTAVAVGAPLGLSNSVTTGIVSALNRSIQVASSALPDNGAQQDQDQGDGGENGEGGPFQFDIPGMGTQQAKQSISIAVIQTDAAINPGNSGGALVDSKGGLIGINVAIATAGQSSGESGSIGVGFAIPSDIAQRVAKEIMENGSATHGLLGATVRDASSLQDASVAGAVIDTPTAGGGAERAGLKRGDIVTEFNGVPIASANDLTAQVRAAAAGSTAKVVYVRSGKTYT
ncbi:MAG TPA: trypsin-like peptidase domain-containing protein, partial [Microbacterium sp.]|nr:trypsin-like peptidase domain-containing protein [Microbacterium sp.]